MFLSSTVDFESPTGKSPASLQTLEEYLPCLSICALCAPFPCILPCAQMTAVVANPPAISTENIKNTLRSESPEEKQRRARFQMEFYFSDSNLPYDKYLWTEHDKTPDHWIPLDKFYKFNRMAEFQSLGLEWLADTLRASTLLEIDEEGKNVRRRTAVVERPKPSVDERSVYVKGFPTTEYRDMQMDLERYFARFGAVACVRMRRDQDKKFKGSVFCEFSDVDTAERFVKPADGSKREFDGTELLVMKKQDYVAMKCEDKNVKLPKPIPPKPRPTFNAFRLMKREGRQDLGAEPGHVPVVKQFNILDQELDIELDPEDNVWKLAKDTDVRYVKRAMVGFVAEGNVKMGAIKAGLREMFSMPSYVVNPPDTNTGYVVFQRGLDDAEWKKLQDGPDFIDGATYKWRELSEDEERAQQLEYVKSSIARRADKEDVFIKGKKPVKRGGHDKGKGNNKRRDTRTSAPAAIKSQPKTETSAPSTSASGDAASSSAMDTDAANNKRKRDAEPDGPETGSRDAGPATIKKARRE